MILIVSTNYIFVQLLDNKVFWSSLMHGTNIKIQVNTLLSIMPIFIKINAER